MGFDSGDLSGWERGIVKGEKREVGRGGNKEEGKVVKVEEEGKGGKAGKGMRQAWREKEK